MMPCVSGGGKGGTGVEVVREGAWLNPGFLWAFPGDEEALLGTARNGLPAASKPGV